MIIPQNLELNKGDCHYTQIMKIILIHVNRNLPFWLIKW